MEVVVDNTMPFKPQPLNREALLKARAKSKAVCSFCDRVQRDNLNTMFIIASVKPNAETEEDIISICSHCVVKGKMLMSKGAK